VFVDWANIALVLRQQKKMARSERFELPTPRFEVWKVLRSLTCRPSISLIDGKDPQNPDTNFSDHANLYVGARKVGSKLTPQKVFGYLDTNDLVRSADLTPVALVCRSTPALMRSCGKCGSGGACAPAAAALGPGGIVRRRAWTSDFPTVLEAIPRQDEPRETRYHKVKRNRLRFARPYRQLLVGHVLESIGKNRRHGAGKRQASSIAADPGTKAVRPAMQMRQAIDRHGDPAAPEMGHRVRRQSRECSPQPPLDERRKPS
jgi:hypothetical protein